MPALLQIPIGGGIDESTDPRRGDPSRPTRLENFQFTKDGAYDQRPGYASFANGPTKAYRLAVHKDQLLAIDGANLWTYRPNGTAAWQSIASVSPCKATWDTALTFTTAISSMDVGYGNGLFVYAFVVDLDGNGNANVFTRIVDGTTGAVVLEDYRTTAAATIAASCKVTIIGASSTIAVVTWQEVLGDVKFARFDLTAPTSAPSTGTAATFSASSLYAVCAMTGGLGIAFVGDSGVAGSRLKVQTRNTSVAAGATANLVEADVPTILACVAGSLTIGGNPVNSIWIAYGYVNGANVDVSTRAVNESTLVNNVAEVATFATLSSGTTRLTIQYVSSTNCVVATGTETATNDGYYIQVTTSAAVSGPARVLRQMTPTGRPFMQGSACYLPVLFFDSDAAQLSTFLVDLNISDVATTSLAVQPRAVIMPRTSSSVVGHVSSVVSLGSSRWSFLVAGDKGLLGRSSGTRVDLDFAAYDNWQSARLGDHTYVSGAVTMCFDGVNLFEAGFLYYHSSGALGLAGVLGGGSLSAGTYQAAVVFEQFDATGAVHRSGAAAPKSVAGIGANDRITYTVYPLALTARQDSSKRPTLACRIYRSLVNQSDLYRVGDIHPASGLLNDPTDPSFTWTDGEADATTGTHPLLYTTGGYLDAVCPPASVAIATHKNRVWLIAGDRRTVWFSTPYITGEAPRFHELLTLSVDDDGEPLTAIGSLDDKLVLFKRGSLYVVVGDGPNDTGAGSDLSSPERISSDVGCIDCRSVVPTPVGLFFQSPRGIMLLTRGLEVQFVGEAVIDTTTTYGVCTSAVLVPNRNQVRFTMATADGGGGNGRMVVYDYRRGRWAVWINRNAEQASGEEGASIQSAVYHPTYGHCLGYHETGGTSAVKYESGFVEGVFNEAVWESPWITPAGLQGEFVLQDVMLLGTRITDHQITVEIEYDFDATRTQFKTWTAAELTTIGAREQLRFTPAYGWAQSIRLRVTIAANGTLGTGQGMTLAGVTLQVEGASTKATPNLAAAAKK